MDEFKFWHMEQGQFCNLHKTCTRCKQVKRVPFNFYEKVGSRGKGQGSGKFAQAKRFNSRCKKCMNQLRVLRKKVKPILEEKYNKTCQYCQQKFDSKYLTMDHIIPVSKGGSDELENLTLACLPCNIEKADRMV